MNRMYAPVDFPPIWLTSILPLQTWRGSSIWDWLHMFSSLVNLSCQYFFWGYDSGIKSRKPWWIKGKKTYLPSHTVLFQYFCKCSVSVFNLYHLQLTVNALPPCSKAALESVGSESTPVHMFTLKWDLSVHLLLPMEQSCKAGPP